MTKNPYVRSSYCFKTRNNEIIEFTLKPISEPKQNGRITFWKQTIQFRMGYQNGLWITKPCSICHKQEVMFRIVLDEEEICFQDCRGNNISSEQFHTGLATPICFICNDILGQEKSWRKIKEEYDLSYGRRDYHSEYDTKVVNRAIRACFLPDPEIGEWLFNTAAYEYILTRDAHKLFFVEL